MLVCLLVPGAGDPAHPTAGAGTFAGGSGALPSSSAQPVAAAAGTAAGEQPGAGEYRWPLPGPVRVSRPFDPPLRRWLPGHRGVDLPSAPQATVRAAGNGTVFFAGTVGGRGVVSVTHTGELRTTYQPVTPVVSTGTPVRRGDVIALLEPGHPGCRVAACLHWGLRRGEVYLDPLTLLGLGRVRLLPVR